MKKITNKNVSEYVDDLIDITENIELNKITILTGSNGSGKSFVRKLLLSKLMEKDKNIKLAAISMEKRAGVNGMEALNAFMRDTEWNPTSISSFHQVEGLLQQEDRYLVFDEPEIGMGDETILGLVQLMNDKLKELTEGDKIKGVLVITHSRDMVQFLNHDKFVYLDDPKMTSIEWVNRVLVPLHHDKLKEKSDLIFREIQNRLNKQKQNE